MNQILHAIHRKYILLIYRYRGKFTAYSLDWRAR